MMRVQPSLPELKRKVRNLDVKMRRSTATSLRHHERRETHEAHPRRLARPAIAPDVARTAASEGSLTESLGDNYPSITLAAPKRVPV
jgi:hypothetical protein